MNEGRCHCQAERAACDADVIADSRLQDDPAWSDAPVPPAYAGPMRSRSVIIGLVLFAVGVLTALLVLSRLVVDAAPVVPVLWFLAMLSGVGFALLLFWLWVQSRRRRRAIRSAVADPRSSTPI